MPSHRLWVVRRPQTSAEDMSNTARPHDATPAECWMLLDEIEHRVANEFAMAISSLSLATARNKATSAAIDDAIQLLQGHAAAHRSVLRPGPEGPVDLSTHLRSICRATTDACLKQHAISLLLLEQEAFVDADCAWRTGLIVHELIINAVKHGFSGTADRQIEIAVWQDDDATSCHFSNNGRATNPTTFGSGFRIMDALAAGMNADLSHTFCETGAATTLYIPRPRHAL
jgi:two-component sensor histidine kinase